MRLRSFNNDDMKSCSNPYRLRDNSQLLDGNKTYLKLYKMETKLRRKQFKLVFKLKTSERMAKYDDVVEW